MDIMSILGIGGKIIDKVFPDKEAADKAKFDLMQLQQNGELKEVEVQMSAILAEAQSKDPWTSRARPSFMYVMYIMILAAIPMGILTIFSPASAAAITTGMKSWLNAIPENLYTLFGVGYLGYTGARTWDKKKKQ